MSTTTLPLAFNTDFDLIDRSNYECTPDEVSLYFAMLCAVHPVFTKHNHELSEVELERIAAIGAPFGLDAERSHRFMIAMAMLEARRKISHEPALEYFRVMNQPDA
jgi:hypothetical protein